MEQGKRMEEKHNNAQVTTKSMKNKAVADWKRTSGGKMKIYLKSSNIWIWKSQKKENGRR